MFEPVLLSLPPALLFFPGFFFFVLIPYFAPAIIAFARNHRNRIAILLLDIFLGWTAIGWIMALIWSLTSNVEPQIRAA